ncbi:MAG: hypothetical protein ACM3OG_03325 [Actinomycetota bacterium]
MPGTPIHRTLLAWICILSLTFAGCAAARSPLSPDGPRPESVHVLAVIPTGSVPEFNVVRMGNSRVVGALQGAGRGFLEGVAAVARGAGGLQGAGNGRGEGEIVVLAVFAAVMLSVGTVNAVIEGVKGSRVPAPYENVSDPDEGARKRFASLRIQEGVARLVEEDARKRLPIPVSLNEIPLGSDGDRERIFRELKESGTDASLVVGIERVAFEGPVGKDQPLSLAITLKARIVRTGDGTTIFEKTLVHRSEPIPVEEWVKDDFLRLLQELDDGLRNLAKRCVSGLLDAGLFPG